LLTQLSRIIRQEYAQVKPHQAKEEAERFVRFICDRAGLLNEYGRGRYAFMHKTFQEYLTAEAILNQAEYEDDSDLIYEAIRTHLHNAHWREVILLLVGQLQGKKAAKAIEVILRQNSLYEQWLYRDLLFAGRCLTEDPEKLATASPESVSEILQQLVHLETEDEERIGELVKKETFEILSWLKESAFAFEALTHLKASTEHLDRWRFMNFQWKLGEKDIALASLLNLLKDEDSDVRSRAAVALGKLGDHSGALVKGLLQLLQDSDTEARSPAASVLGKFSDRSETVVNGLFQLLQDSDLGVSNTAARALGDLGDRSGWVLKGLLELLKDESSAPNPCAAYTLGKLGDRSEEVLLGLLEFSHMKPQ
jgi:HEAT repeats/HEAT repeat